MTEKLGQNFETIDNEKIINKKLDNKQKAIALGILKVIDTQTPDIDIDLAYNKKSDNYYFVANNEALNIPLKLNNLPKFGSILVKLFNKDIQLFGDLYSRAIAADTWKLDGLEEKFIKNGDFGLTKNDIEKIFTFIMRTKNIPIEDWKIESSVCKGGINKKCKEALSR